MFGKKNQDQAISAAGNSNIRIKLSSFVSSSLDKAVYDLFATLKRVGAVVIGPVPLPNSAITFTVNRSPHGDGKAKEKYRIVRHSRMMIIIEASANEIEAISSINISSGVGVEIQVFSGNKKKK